ncbi:16030_t:CDS:2, partial [Funneliformis geosporum]
SRSLKEPIFLNGRELHGAFSYTKYFCPIRTRKFKDKFAPENQDKFLIMDSTSTWEVQPNANRHILNNMVNEQNKSTSLEKNKSKTFTFTNLNPRRGSLPVDHQRPLSPAVRRRSFDPLNSSKNLPKFQEFKGILEE